MRECGLILLTLTNIKRERGREGRKKGRKEGRGGGNGIHNRGFVHPSWEQIKVVTETEQRARKVTWI